MRFLLQGIVAFLAVSPANLLAEGRASHVVVVVWDGMRPDFIRPDLTPTLCKLASNGVFFADHHSVYCTATDANGTAMATGAYPGHSGIIANNMYFPAINSNKPVTVAIPAVMAKGDEVTGGKFIARPTIAEVLRSASKRTAIVGAKLIARMHDRHDRTDECLNACVFEGDAMPSKALAAITNQIGVFPNSGVNAPNTGRDEWSRRALTEVLWTGGVPEFSLLWLSEPDASQHATSPGSERSRAAIRSSDQQLAAVIAELKRRKLLDQTDIFVVSDHGFSTVQQPLDLAAILKENGFRAKREFESPESGDVLVVGQGGSVFLHVFGHDSRVTGNLVRFLQAQEFSGVIFSREELPGTFPLTAAHLDVSDAPDVVLSLRWSTDENENKTPGMFYSDGGRPKGGGNHASLSRFDFHNTLVASGPDFKKGVVNRLPSANTDLAPTILHLLGVRPEVPMDGRILSEALNRSRDERRPAKPVTVRLEAVVTNGASIWQQYLKTTRMDNTLYLDEGNGKVIKDE